MKLDDNALADLSRKEGFKPYVLAEDVEGKQVELISYPYPEGGEVEILVRTIPGDPTSMEPRLVKNLKIPKVEG